MRVLPADVYDTLEFSALAWGGIGADRLVECDPEGGQRSPLCAFGHAGYATAEPHDDYWNNPIGLALIAGFGELQTVVNANNLAVYRINRLKGSPTRNARVTFAEWCSELGVVRGE